MPKLYIMRGLPACGKSTYVREHLAHCKRVNRDSIRRMLGVKFNPKLENDVSAVERMLLGEYTLRGEDVVVDNTNLNPQTFGYLKALAEKRGYTPEVVDLTFIPPWQCVENDKRRPVDEQVGPEVIWEKWYKYLAPEPYKGDSNLSPVIVSDIDGTVRDNSWRDPYDLTGKCINDPPRMHVINAIRGCQGNPDRPIAIQFLSVMEFSDENYTATAEWLSKYFANFTLAFRYRGDRRRDSIVKTELFNKIVRPCPVIAVFDDRPQVIRECWVPLGLYDRVFSVGKPCLEF